LRVLLAGSSAVMLTLSFPAASYSQSLTAVDIDKINETANIICNQLQLSGSSSTIALSAEAEAEARLLLKSLGSAAGELDISGYISKFENVPRDELAEFLTSAQDCRLEIFRELRVLAGSEPQQGKLAWRFPHVVSEGVALGVINVVGSGGGVDINWRVRNVSAAPLFMKFGGSTYTDHIGNICQKGSLTTGVRGIPFKSNEDPIAIKPGDSLQFASYNVRCDGNNFSESGDILAVMLAGPGPDSLAQIRYEIADVENIVDR